MPPALILRKVCGPGHPICHDRASREGIDFLEDASSTDFFWEFAQAEVRDDGRHDRMYGRGLGPALLARVRLEEREGLTRSQHALLKKTVLSTRPEYLRPLLWLGLRWSFGELPLKQLPHLRVPNLDIFRPTAPSRLLGDFAAALDQGAPTLWPPVAENYRRMRPRFKLQRMVGSPIVMGASSEGPFTIVEGLTRLSVLASRLRGGEPVPSGIRLLVGLGPKARDWWCY